MIRLCRAIACAALVAVAGLCAISAPLPPADLTPRQIYDALDALRVNPDALYAVHSLRLQRDTVALSLDDGTLGFLADFQGKLTGAVFTGRGRILAIPRDSGERRSLVRFLDEPILDQPITGAYIRFTDNTAQELFDQIQSTQAQKTQDADFVTHWNRSAASLNSSHSLRIMMDLLSDRPIPYFFANLWSDSLGMFDVLVDNRYSEQVLAGQSRWSEGAPYYDIWTSFAREDVQAPPVDSFKPVSYEITTTIEPDRTLEGTTTVTLRAVGGGERVVALELSRFLTVQTVEDAAGNDLTCFQNEALNRNQLADQGNDLIVIVLTRAPQAGQTVKLRLSYRGGVISDAGNGVLFVGDRGSWYPHIPGFGNFSSFDLTFHWPHRLRLIATGTPAPQEEDADWDTGHWHSEDDIPVAGFNLGDYRSNTASLPGGGQIEVLANSELERSLASLFRSTPLAQPEPDLLPPGHGVHPSTQLPIEPPNPVELPSPASQVRHVAQEISDAVRLEEHWLGPFPFARLEVSQMPGSFGQGWPGLIYLPTMTFLTPDEQQRVGVTGDVQEDYNEIVPFHEVAHQWLGDTVGWQSYRDQWIDEALSNYVALLAIDSRNTDAHLLRRSLDLYRDDLNRPAAVSGLVADIGPVTLGGRLDSARDTDAYQKIVYGKGTWVFHMLRMMLREPGARDPDARFTAFLHALINDYRDRPLSNDDLQRAIENVMTPSMALEEKHSMAWFFDQWVHGSGMPHYSVQYALQPKGSGLSLNGTLAQEGVPENFLAAVPIYAQSATGRETFLGNVVTTGRDTQFHFVVASNPKRILIDPQQTILCTHD
jgi:hypothetical protein